jgi:hypothetical protein
MQPRRAVRDARPDIFIPVGGACRQKYPPLTRVKHSFETPKRKMVLFLLDSTKQLLSSGLLHITNIAFSVVIGSTQNDQCGIYLMTFVVDISLGILICYYLLKLVDKILSYRKSKVLACHQQLKSGNYFTKMQMEDGSFEVGIDYFVWFEQTAIWLLIVFVVVEES